MISLTDSVRNVVFTESRRRGISYMRQKKLRSNWIGLFCVGTVF